MAVFDKWRRKAVVGNAGPDVLASYTKPGWLSRHRKLVLTVTFVVLFFYSAFFLLIGRFLIVQFTAPLAILAVLIIWALPERDSIPDKLLYKFFIAFMAAMLFWPNYLALDLPTLPWITAARLFGVPMVFLFLICLSQSTAFRGVIKHALATNPTITKMMIVFTALCVLSVGFSTSPSLSANHLIIALVNWVSIFFISLWVFSKSKNVERFVWLLWGTTLFWCAMGFWEWWYSQVPWAGHIPSFLAVEDETVQKILTGSARAATGLYRVQGKYTTSLGMAEFMALMTPFLLHIMLEARKLIVRIAAGMTLPVVFWIIIATDSRLGAVGFLLSLMFYLLFWGARRWMHDRESLFGPAVTLAYPILFMLFIVATFTVRRLRNMVWGGGAQQASNDARQAQMEMGIPDIMSRPWGYGIGRAGETLGYQNGAGILTIDNYYLSILLEIGILGFFVYYGMFLVAIVRGGIRGMRDTDETTLWVIPAVISLANFVVIKSVLSQQEAHPLVFAILGLVVALLARPVGVAVKAPDAPLSSLPVGQFGQRSDGRLIPSS
jgi:O-Antigen ligase